MQHKQAWTLIFLLAAIKLIIPYIGIHPAFELQRDEYLYLSYAQHMDWGYMEAPPLISIFSWLSFKLGNSMAVVRFWPAFVGALNIVLIGKMVLRLGGKTFACLIACLGFLVAGYLRVGILLQPNFLEVFCWTWSAYFLISLIKTDQPKYLYWLAVSLAIGFLAKYSVLFFIIAIIVGFLLTPNRKWFANKHLYFAFVLALIIAAPNLWWQYQHRFPVIHHMKLLQEQQLENLNRSDFIINQFLITLPCFFVWIAGLWYAFFTKQGKPLRLFGWTYMALFTLLLILHGKPYYTIGIYPMLLVLGALHLENVTTGRSLKWLRIALPAFMIILCLPLLPVLLPLLSPKKLGAFYIEKGLDKAGILKWEEKDDNALPQDFADMLGWKEITEKVARVYNSFPDSVKAKTFIYCRNYGQAGSVNYFAKQFQLNATAYSDNASFLFWMPNNYNLENLLFVGHNLPGSDDAVFQMFEKVTIVDSVTNTMSRQYQDKIILYEHAKPGTNELIEKGIKEDKRQFIR